MAGKTYSELMITLKARSEAAQVALAEAKAAPPVLQPVRHPQMDFFVAGILDVANKGDLASMEHPLFALKSGDRRVRTYERNGVTVTIKPGHDGCATMHDKDLWIYCTSQLVEALNRGREDVSRTVRLTAHDFLVATNRPTDGDSYQRMADALGRLRGTSIETNIATDGQRERAGFGLIDAWRIIERRGGRMVAVEVVLPDWLYRSIQARQVLTLSPDYFRIRKPLHRRIYELARKHCGGQTDWKCGLRVLHQKSGSTAPIRNFRGEVRALALTDDLPDYSISIDAHDGVVFRRRRGPAGQIATIDDLLSRVGH